MLGWLDMGWMSWLGIGGLGAAGLAAWALGLPTLFKVLGAVVDIAAPVLKAIAEGIVWVWQWVLWPGIKDILDTWATVLTVGGLMVGLFLFMQVNDGLRLAAKGRDLQVCQTALSKARKPIPSTTEPQIWEFRFPGWQ